MGSPSSPVSEITLLNETGVFPGVAGCLFLAFFGGGVALGRCPTRGPAHVPRGTTAVRHGTIPAKAWRKSTKGKWPASGHVRTRLKQYCRRPGVHTPHVLQWGSGIISERY